MIRVNRLGLTKDQKVSALGLGNISYKKKEIIDNNDFLPVVLINPSEEAKNAIISLDDCNESKIEKIYLGKDYDKKFQNYNVANIVIAKRSIAKIPLRIKRGYDPSGFQDEDGELQFLTTNGVVKLNYIDNDDTDYKEGEDKYNIKDASNGDVFVLEIDASGLERGTKFSININATDKKEFWGQTSKRKGICGKFNVKVVENDVFLEHEVDRLLKENEISMSRKTECIIAADKQIGKLLENTKDFITDISNNGANVETIFKRIDQLIIKNFISSRKIFDQHTFEGGGYYQPKEYSSGNKDIIHKFLKNDINGKIGYHIYVFTILNGFHVLTLIINNKNPDVPTYNIYDQITERNHKKLSEINNEFLGFNVRNWQYAVEDSKKRNPNAKDCSTKFAIWKIKR